MMYGSIRTPCREKVEYAEAMSSTETPSAPRTNEYTGSSSAVTPSRLAMLASRSGPSWSTIPA